MAAGFICLLFAPSRATSRDAAPGADTARRLPLSFDGEIVRLTLDTDSLQVDGTYFMTCRDASQRWIAIRYPYPVDERLGGARTCLLSVRAEGGPWRDAEFRELAEAGIAAVDWRIPLDLGERIEVHTVYCQALRSRFARYIVTTTATWRRPLRSARFEIRLPQNARPVRFSYPFERVQEGEDVYYLFTAEDFMPEREIEVEWAPAEARD